MSEASRTSGDLAQERAELLRRKLRERGINTGAGDAMRKTSRTGPNPLSYSQRRLWFVDRFEPGNPAYNIPAAIRLIGKLDAGALERSLSEVVRRHEVLRTCFEEIDGQPAQVVTPTCQVDLSIVSLEELPKPAREAEMRRRAAAEAAKAFDLRSAPMLRASLLALSDQEYVLLLVMHHIASDGWSIGVFVREMAALYEAFARGGDSPRNALTIQYADYAVWQLEWLKTEAAQAQLAYWKEKLSGEAETLELPFDRSRSAATNPNGALQRFTISPQLTERLKALSQQYDATLFMTLLAGFKILLHRYTGQRSVNVATSVAGRNRIETENLIGFFLNTLILRTDLFGDPSVRDLLSRVRETALGAYANQELPVEMLIEALQPERSANLNRLFQAMFIFQNTPMPPLALPGLTLSLIEIETGAAKFDLTLSMEETGQGLTGFFEYNADLFDAPTIERMSAHLLILLEAIAADPGCRVSQLPLMSADETRRLLKTLNETGAEFPRRLCIHELFESQVARTPMAIAIACEGEQVDYRELNARANRLAHYLKALGASPETLIGLCVERSVEMIVGLLGVLKAGAAYVPIDPAYPRTRLAHIIEESKISVLLTQKGLRERLPGAGVKLVDLDSQWEVIARQSADNLPDSARAENAAYVIYTSGSTGTPKGVIVTHKALVNHTVAAANDYGFAPGDRVLQFASLSFDTSAEEIFPTLTRGATLVLHPDTMLSSVAGFLQKCEAMRLTALDLPTAYWHEIVAGLSAETVSLPDSIRLVIIGGEPALLPRLQHWKKQVGSHVRLSNTYGPTEATIVATRWEATDADVDSLSSVPIGRPIANTQVYILDQHLRPVPEGVAGELYIGGEGLARGYLNWPDLTAERFIPNPFGDELGLRLYRTGDRARWLPDGNVQFLGRADGQVKVRGFRIEIEEIEKALARVPGVYQSVVLVREDRAGDRRLVAYLVASDSAELSPKQLRNHLKEILPDFMIPSAFVLLNEMPLTRSGKLDRQALPAPDGKATSGGSGLAPRDELEQTLATIWSEVLNRTDFGVEDDFFDLGGHSLLAMRIIARLSEQLAIDVPVKRLFESSTIADLAECVRNLRGNMDEQEDPAIPRLSRESRRVSHS